MSTNDDPFWAMLEKHGLQPYIFSGIGPGWVPLVDQLITDMKAAGWKGQIAQVKEKYGSLRFYYDSEEDCDHDLIRELVDKAESKSFTICEWCGAPGSNLEGDYKWYITLCEECLEKYKSGKERQE